LGEYGHTTLRTRFQLACKVFALTSAYDAGISQWLAGIDPESHAYFQESADA
jgi:phosphoribosylaminoimidazolecarboxamide formyltransferase/IMP cyclohydrolase